MTARTGTFTTTECCWAAAPPPPARRRSTAGWYSGGNPNDAGWYVTGASIDEEAIYNRGLTANEVAALANVGSYGGVYRPLNTTVLAAANYDYGGEGVGYHSVTTDNVLSNGSTGVYRTDNVSIENTSDTMSGHQPYDITSTQPGEWFAYTASYSYNPGTLTPTAARRQCGCYRRRSHECRGRIDPL